jgi:hypothetical protein
MDTKSKWFKWAKAVLATAFGVIGIAFATLMFGPADMPFAAELSKFAPDILMTMLVLFAAEVSVSEARGSRDEARASREAGERAEVEARLSHLSAERAEVEARTGSERAERAEQEARIGRERAELAVGGSRKQKRLLRKEVRQTRAL